jgi:hypothetical protein
MQSILVTTKMRNQTIPNILLLKSNPFCSLQKWKEESGHLRVSLEEGRGRNRGEAAAGAKGTGRRRLEDRRCRGGAAPSCGEAKEERMLACGEAEEGQAQHGRRAGRRRRRREGPDHHRRTLGWRRRCSAGVSCACLVRNRGGEATGEKEWRVPNHYGLISGGIAGKFRELFALTVTKSRCGLAVSFTLGKS